MGDWARAEEPEVLLKINFWFASNGFRFPKRTHSDSVKSDMRKLSPLFASKSEFPAPSILFRIDVQNPGVVTACNKPTVL